jgi:hypothetical protein
MGRFRGELGTRGEECGKMKDGVDFVFALKSFEEELIKNVAHNGRTAPRRDRGIDRADINADDLRAVLLGKTLNEAVPLLTVCTRHKDRGFADMVSHRKFNEEWNGMKDKQRYAIMR